jgi:hypothetical protein
MTPQFPKPKRVIDPTFLNRVRHSRCAVVGCCRFYIDPHHLITRGSGGSDHTAIPLCREHHAELHTIGKKRFEEECGLDLWAVNARQLAEYAVELTERLDSVNEDNLNLRHVIRSLEESAYKRES